MHTILFMLRYGATITNKLGLNTTVNSQYNCKSMIYNAYVSIFQFSSMTNLKQSFNTPFKNEDKQFIPENKDGSKNEQ